MELDAACAQWELDSGVFAQVAAALQYRDRASLGLEIEGSAILVRIECARTDKGGCGTHVQVGRLQIGHLGMGVSITAIRPSQIDTSVHLLGLLNTSGTLDVHAQQLVS